MEADAEAAVQLRLLERLEGFRLPGLAYHGQPFATTLLRYIDRMALFILPHLLLFVRGETAENRKTQIIIANQNLKYLTRNINLFFFFMCYIYIYIS